MPPSLVACCWCCPLFLSLVSAFYIMSTDVSTRVWLVKDSILHLNLIFSFLKSANLLIKILNQKNPIKVNCAKKCFFINAKIFLLSCKMNIFALRKIVLEPKYLEVIAPLIVVIGIIFENCHIGLCCTRLWKCFFWARLLFMILNHVVHCTIQKPIGHHHRNKNPWRGFFQKIKD